MVKSTAINKTDGTMARSSRRFCRTIYDENTGRMKMRIQYLREYEPETEPKLAKEQVLSRLLSMLLPRTAGAGQAQDESTARGLQKRGLGFGQALEVEVGVQLPKEPNRLPSSPKCRSPEARQLRS